MEKWQKIKEFITSKKPSDKITDKDRLFNAILALYAGDDPEEVFSDLTLLYEKHP